jgi:hypothetical protein
MRDAAPDDFDSNGRVRELETVRFSMIGAVGLRFLPEGQVQYVAWRTALRFRREWCSPIQQSSKAGTIGVGRLRGHHIVKNRVYRGGVISSSGDKAWCMSPYINSLSIIRCVNNSLSTIPDQ